MPTAVSYPGVYIEEIPSGVHTIVGVSTSDTAFVDVFARGPAKATRITSWADFERTFGGLYPKSEASFAIQQYYLNGGSAGWVVRVVPVDASTATIKLPASSGDSLIVNAANPGSWGNSIQVGVDLQGVQSGDFNLVVREVNPTHSSVLSSEIYRNLNMDKTSANYALTVVNSESSLIQLEDAGGGSVPDATAPTTDADMSITNGLVINTLGAPTNTPVSPAGYWSIGPGYGYYPDPFKSLTSGADGGELTEEVLIGDSGATPPTGIYALDKIAPFVFNIMCLPAAAKLDATSMAMAYTYANVYCQQKRAFLIVDIRDTVHTAEQMISYMGTSGPAGNLRSPNNAFYFPRLEIANPLNANRLADRGYSGTMAGIYARTDAERGVWKAPAGIGATIEGASIPHLGKLTNAQNGPLNELGINALRSFPVYGDVSWGARTGEGADQLASEWKYIPVRRLTLFIEGSLYEGLTWAVFEPNDDGLWGEIRLNVGAFMSGLFSQGAFAGSSASSAFFVKCDATTTTADDQNKGIVNVIVGFAPVKPAEFIIVQIQQIAGQA